MVAMLPRWRRRWPVKHVRTHGGALTRFFIKIGVTGNYVGAFPEAPASRTTQTKRTHPERTPTHAPTTNQTHRTALRTLI